MNFKYIPLMFLAAAFFMTGCSSGKNNAMDTADNAKYYDNTGNGMNDDAPTDEMYGADGINGVNGVNGINTQGMNGVNGINDMTGTNGMSDIGMENNAHGTGIMNGTDEMYTDGGMGSYSKTQSIY